MRQVLLGRLKETSVCIFNLALFLHPNGNRPGLTNYGHICLLYVTFKMTNFQEHITTFIYYRPPTKLLEGNFFSRVCLSTCLFTRGDPMWPLACAGTPSPDMVPHCTGTPHSPKSEHGTSLYRDSPKSADIWRMWSGNGLWTPFQIEISCCWIDSLTVSILIFWCDLSPADISSLSQTLSHPLDLLKWPA